MRGTESILQVVLIREDAVSRDLGPMLWATLREVELLYNLIKKPTKFERLYVAKSPPEFLTEEDVLPQSRVDSSWPGIWAKSGQRRTFDANVLTERVRQLLEIRSGVKKLVIVTDQEITPPSQWRYVIWDQDSQDDTVISLAPIDPRYWASDIMGAAREQIIKQRVRAACCSVVGEGLGLVRCENPGCFLYSSVSSVNRLDEMVYIGGEHNIAELTGVGFEAFDQEEIAKPNLLVSLGRKVGLLKNTSVSDVQTPQVLKRTFGSEAST